MEFENIICKIIQDNPDEKSVEWLMSEYIRQTGEKIKSKSFLEDIKGVFLFTHIAVLLNKDSYISHEKLFKNSRFLVNLTDYELKRKIFIPGHRFGVFLNPSLQLSNITLLDPQGKKLDGKDHVGKNSDIGIFFSLMMPERYKGNLKITKDKNSFSVDIFEIADFIKTNQLDLDTKLLISTLDYAKGIYRIEEQKDVPSDSFFINQNRKIKIENTLLNLFHDKEILPVHLALLKTFAILGNEISENPVDTLSNILQRGDLLELDNSIGMVVVKPKGLNLVDFVSSQPISKETLKKMSPLDKLFVKYGISYTTDFVISMMILQLDATGKIDHNKIVNTLLSGVFMNILPQKDIDKFSDEVRKIEFIIAKKWKGLKISEKWIKAIDLVVKQKIANISFLREVNDITVDYESIDFNFFTPFHTFEEFTDICLEEFAAFRFPDDIQAEQIIETAVESKKHFTDFKKQVLRDIKSNE